MKLTEDQWDLGHLWAHLQSAAELEAWTIPYYMATMFSIEDRFSEAYQLIQSVVHQEMLHLQLVANVANAYGYSPTIGANAFVYDGQTIPHLDFSLDPDNPTKLFAPYSSAIGPLDTERINGMCLVEYPEWETGGKPDLRDDISEYGSIGEFYDAVEYGARLLSADIVGGRRQVDLFSAFYRDLPKLVVDATGPDAFAEVALLIDIIRDQGEGAKAADAIKPPFRNTADDSQPDINHYDKFQQIRAQAGAGTLPKAYAAKPVSEYTTEDQKRLRILVENFTQFSAMLTDLFSGGNPDGFAPMMATIGGNILSCWKSQVTPAFTDRTTTA